MGATFGRIKSWITGESFTASDINAEFNNILNNLTPAGVDDYSATTGQMDSTSDPYPGSVQTQATSSAGELEQLRYVLVQILGETDWYNDADGSLADVFTNAATFAGKKTFSNNVIFTKGADVASAGALSLGVDGNYFDITGTTTITSIDSVGIGAVIRLHFDGILILTHDGADIILPTGANITTAAGDESVWVEYALNDWRCVSYTRADGSALTPTDITGILGTWDLGTKSKDTNYQAATDVFVIVYWTPPNTSLHTVTGITDSGATPSQVVAKATTDGQTLAFVHMMFPVKKDDYWKVADVTTGATVTINVIPIGS